MTLEGSEPLVLSTIMRARVIDSSQYVADSLISQITHLHIDEVRDCLESLEEKKCVERSLGTEGFSAYITATGRQILRKIRVMREHGYISMSEPPSIIPAGLRPYDERDQHYFFQLIPGAYFVGVPEAIHLWKSWIEVKDPNNLHPLRVLYGPNGCGKTSLIKAGVLSHIDTSIHSIYIDVRSVGSIPGLCQQIQDRILSSMPLSSDSCLDVDRKGLAFSLPSERMLLVMDQFEHGFFLTTQETELTELVLLLKGYINYKLQIILVVRDDFRDLAEKFIQLLGLSYNRKDDSIYMNFYPKYHAAKVLEAFGKSYRILGDCLTPEEKEFLHEAVNGLSDGDHVVPVRLALLFQMIRGMEWKPEILSKKGGFQGMIKAYLQNELCAEHANPRYRQHRDAAKAVLRALLPRWMASGTLPMRPQDVLAKTAGYHNSMRDWEELMQILDAEMRLVKPVLMAVGNGNVDLALQQVICRLKCYYQLIDKLYVHAIKRIIYQIHAISYINHKCCRLVYYTCCFMQRLKLR